ncbi:MAG: GspE/PulE family protein [Pseudomonadota bacterium]
MNDASALAGNEAAASGGETGPAGLGPLERRLGETFVAEGRLTRADLARAALLAARSNQPFRLLLDRLGLVSLSDWAAAAAQETGLELIEADGLPRRLPVDPRLSESFMRRRAVMPLELTATRARFATPDPLDPQTVSALRLIFGDRLELAVASDRDIDAAFERADAADESGGADALGLEASEAGDDLERLIELANNAPTIRFVEELFGEALSRRATDIHLEPMSEKPRVRFRVDGILVEGEAPAAAIYRGVVSRLKILSNLDVAERRQPQDGRIAYRADNRRIDIRIAIAPTIHGEAVTLRFLDARTGLTALHALDMPADVATTFHGALSMPNGLVLVTGPTGSGKTTTLHAALAELNDVGRKIVTIENPVEILTPGLIQIEVDPRLDWTFANALRAILRHDPDVLMVGEIRDEETAEMAVRLALTGHLVFSTIHTNSASEGPTRLANLGVAEHLMASTLRMVASQRLVRGLCPACARPADADATALYDGTVREAVAANPHWQPPSDVALRQPGGCTECGDQGFRGRIGVFEAFGAKAALATLSPGFDRRHRSMGEHGLERVAAGETTLDEVLRVVGPPGAWS